MQSSPIHHLALGARAPEALAAFYCSLFGLRESARHRDDHGDLRSIWLSIGDGVLMIEKTTRPPRARVSDIDAGLFLLAFQSEDLRADQARLERLGVVVESRSEYSLYFRDPEGNRCALSAYPLSTSTRLSQGS